MVRKGGQQRGDRKEMNGTSEYKRTDNASRLKFCPFQSLALILKVVPELKIRISD